MWLIMRYIHIVNTKNKYSVFEYKTYIKGSAHFPYGRNGLNTSSLSYIFKFIFLYGWDVLEINIKMHREIYERPFKDATATFSTFKYQ